MRDFGYQEWRELQDSNRPDDELGYIRNAKQVALKRVELAMQCWRPQSMKYDINEMEKDVEYTFRSFVWGEGGKIQTIRYPADWWQAFKERWFPAWLLTRYPVQYKEHEISADIIYPFMNVSLPNKTHTLHFSVLERLAN